MGYNGLGMQRWISTMKPRKFLGKRSKPDGGGGEPSAGPSVSSYYHIKKRDFSRLRSKVYSKAYKQQLNAELDEDKKNSVRLMIISVFVGMIFILILGAYFNSKLNWF